MLIFISCTSTKVSIDKYEGNINSAIKKLGNKYQLRTYVVNRNYKFRYEIEPDYYKYFSEGEKTSDVQVYEYKWIKGKKTVFIWAKKEIEDIVIFSSVEYSGDVRF